MDDEVKNKASVSDALKNAAPEFDTVMCGDIEVHVRRSIPMRDYAELVESVCAACFDEMGNYRPYVRQYVLDAEVLRKYTDIEMPDDFDELLKIVDVMNSHRSADNYTWMEEIYFIVGGQAISSDVRERIKFELDKYERETHEMVQRMSNTVRAFGILLEDAISKMPVEEEQEDKDEEESGDTEGKVISMPVTDNGN